MPVKKDFGTLSRVFGAFGFSMLGADGRAKGAHTCWGRFYFAVWSGWVRAKIPLRPCRPAARHEAQLPRAKDGVTNFVTMAKAVAADFAMA